MGTALFIWLGSGRARRRKVAQRGVCIDQAAQAGLPVPPGAILLQELLQVFTREGLVESGQGRVSIPDPELLHNTLLYSVRLPRFRRPVMVRPLFPSGTGMQPRGEIPATFLSPVDLNDAGDTARALTAVWSAASRLPDVRADVLLMECVEAKHTGLAHTAAAGDTDQIESTGDEPMTLQPLTRLRGWQKPDPGLPPYARRLQLLLGGVRRTFGRGDWTIEWADDGRICWLLDVFSASEASS